MAARRESLHRGREIVDAVLVAGEIQICCAGRCRSWTVHRDLLSVLESVAVRPFDRRTRHTEIALVHGKGGACHRLPLGREGGRSGRGERDARIRCPASCGARGAHEGRPLLGVDGDAHTLALQQRSRGQAEGSTADHGNVLVSVGESLAHRDGSRSPGERPATATMAVVVYDELVADPFGIQTWPRRAEGPQTDGDTKDAILMRADRRNRAHSIVEGKRWHGSRADMLCTPRKSQSSQAGDST